eukprot:s8_g32.t1
MDRIEPQHFFDALEDLMGGLCFQVLEKIMLKRLPTVWTALPSSVQHELKLKVLEDTKQSFGKAMVDLKTNISSILDLQEMAVETFVNNPRMMVDMFRSVALKELVFIQRVAAVMGFVLGLVQVVFYIMLKDKPGMDYIMLPVSGLIIGYFTNLLALKMTFRPVWPHQFCNGRVNVQGVFLKRQREASQKMAELICRNVVDARAMLNYMLRSPSSTGVEKVLEIYRNHVGRSVDKSMGIAKNMAMVAPATLGSQIDEMKQDVIDFSLELLPQHSRAIEDYMDRTMNVQETLTWRLSRISPPEFESIIHPIFQDDEWILLVVGGFLGEVYEHMELQLRQVLERDRTCAELAARCLSLSRNLISDVVAFLLLAATHLTQTDSLPSLEVVVLWQSLPTSRTPLPSRTDPQLQKDAWQSMLGMLVSNLLSLRWTFHLFAGNGAEEELAHAVPEGSTALIEAPESIPAGFPAQVRRVREDGSCYDMPRMTACCDARENLLVAVESLFDLLYLIGEVLSQFHRISDSLGDYGMIRVALWLHPCLDCMVEKLQRLQSSLKGLNRAVDAELVIAKARGRSLKKPLPSERMSARGHAAIQRALAACRHLAALLQSLEELPHVVEGLGDACSQLQNVLSSSHFRARVGDAFPRLPPLANMGRASSRPALRSSCCKCQDEAPMGDYSEPEEEQATSACAPIHGPRCIPRSSAGERARSPQPATSAGKDASAAAALSLPLPNRERAREDDWLLDYVDSPDKSAFQSCLFFAQADRSFMCGQLNWVPQGYKARAFTASR